MRSARALPVLVLLTIAVRLVPAFAVYGTEDVWAWRFAVELRASGEDPYLQDYHFNWPPAWLAAVSWLFPLARALHLPWYGLVKLYPILADALIAALLWKSQRSATGDLRSAFRAGLFWALNPVSVAITSLHGNFLSVPLSLLFLSAYLLHFERARWGPAASAIACGCAIMTKTWPVFFLPLLLLRARERRVLYLALCAVLPLGLVMSFYLRPDGALILARFFGYQSVPGWWGITSLWHAWPTEGVRTLVQFYADHGAKVLASVLVALYLLRAFSVTAGGDGGTDFFAGFVPIGLGMLVFAPGFGPQYLLWVLPFAIVARDRWVWVFTGLATLLLGLEYGFRPYTGEIGLYLREDQPELSPAQAWHDNRLTCFARLPVWLFLGAWLAARAWPRRDRRLPRAASTSSRPALR